MPELCDEIGCLMEPSASEGVGIEWDAHPAVSTLQQMSERGVVQHQPSKTMTQAYVTLSFVSIDQSGLRKRVVYCSRTPRPVGRGPVTCVTPPDARSRSQAALDAPSCGLRKSHLATRAPRTINAAAQKPNACGMPLSADATLIRGVEGHWLKSIYSMPLARLK